ncbi:MAG: hypothetical protein L0241_02865 [Planctomycetia bacterium]|nr:hypothetical protein [Planctomycetia bacterium]
MAVAPSSETPGLKIEPGGVKPVTITATHSTASALNTSPEVKRFVETHDLAADAEHAIQLVKKLFPPASGIALAVREITEDGFESLVIKVTAPLTPETATERYFQFLSEWGTSPAKARERMCLKVIVA